MNRLFHVLINLSTAILSIVQVIQSKVILYNVLKLINIRIENLKKDEDAIICYDKAIQIDPNFTNAYINKGYYFFYSNRQFFNNFEKILISYKKLRASNQVLPNQ